MQSREIIGEDRGIERKREREEHINLLTHNERGRERKREKRFVVAVQALGAK